MKLRIAGLAVALLLPLGALGAQGPDTVATSYAYDEDPIPVVMMEDTVVTYPVRGYELNKFAARIPAGALRGYFSERSEVIVVGISDENPFKSCGGNADCNKSKNLKLGLDRADVVAAELTSNYGVKPWRIHTRSEVAKGRGPEHRGVTIYGVIRYTLAPTAVPATQTPSKVNTDSLGREVTTLRDSLGKIATAVTKSTEQQTTHKTPPAEVKWFSTDVNIGAGVSAMSTGHDGVDSFTPTLSVGIRPLVLPRLELKFEGGYRPSRSEEVCNRADLSWAIAAHVRVWREIAAVGGYANEREICSDGGIRLTGRYLENTGGPLIGGSLGLPLNNRFKTSLTLSLSPRAITRLAEGDKKLRSNVFRVGFNIETHNNKH